MDKEIESFTRIRSVPFVASVKHTGSFDSGNGRVNYAIVDFLPGKDLINAYSQLSLDQQQE
jgi:hypothetical protein